MSLIGKKIVDNATEPPGFLLWKAFAPTYTMATDNGTTNFGLVRAGQVMALISASGKARPCSTSLATNAGAGATAVVTVASTTGMRVADTIGVNGTTTTRTIASVDSATQITLSGNATWAIGDEIHAMDGSRDAIGINLYDATTWEGGVDGDGNTVHRDRGVYILRAGAVSESGLEVANLQLEAPHKTDMPAIVVEP